LAGRDRLGLTVAWSRLGHSGRGTCCQPHGAAAARALSGHRWPRCPPLRSHGRRRDASLPGSHATPTPAVSRQGEAGLELGPAAQSKSMTRSLRRWDTSLPRRAPRAVIVDGNSVQVRDLAAAVHDSPCTVRCCSIACTYK
jgi:hypothetical protein